MNIFILDTHPVFAAEMLCDKHIVKMTLETAQLLSNVYHIALKGTNPFVSMMEYDIQIVPLYKLTHAHHPCSIWTQHSQKNFEWLLHHGIALYKEYFLRYKKIHKSQKVIDWCVNHKSMIRFQMLDMQEFIQAIPEQYKCLNPVDGYRKYYLKEKMRFAKWEHSRKVPEWIICASNK
ncbi:pyrimidine dimer DNA glycosylase/endonuclease V [Wolbachia endosymbiont of Howardula sp.]|uniref:pyrimidine dimer DNA glycosylase/endonuclease V n=1 Tax=Wolbachia endosymbiont of Howardula sp. TaxID=2916816 RepID=UPI00217DC53C|nr:pyrimidine dimer DNA glycosylase/endonuclease V [Wolbachia endosymbiont of Howardula sp.]UWI83112.1 pyrimidine dimer DNA glycosylase/endonuclease V [Wolbachia endosymbiont of Howardula sp.]